MINHQPTKIFLSSTQKLYETIANGKGNNFTVPAFNLRTLTFNSAKALFRAAKKEKVGAFIVELAQSEMNYTNQSPQEYASYILTAAVEEDFEGPIFLQGDHFRIKTKANNKKKELKKLENLIKKSIKAGFYNLDLDCSSLPLTENTVTTAYLTNFIRKIEPHSLTIAIGAEIGEIGGKNTTLKEFNNFIAGYKEELYKYGHIKGIIKIAVQTGTVHGKGGKIDFGLVGTLSRKAKECSLAGIVQHGASTLSERQLEQLPKMKVLEAHLATELQSIIINSQYFPERLKIKVYPKVYGIGAGVKKESLGKFKEEIKSLPQKAIDKICEELEEKFRFFFQRLNVSNTRDLIKEIYPHTKGNAPGVGVIPIKD